MPISVHEQGHLEEAVETFTEGTAKRLFHVATDDQQPVLAATALAATGVPSLGDVHPQYPLRKANRRSVAAADGDETRESWVVTVEYTDALDLLFLEDRVSWGGSTGTELFFWDQSPTPIPAANSAGEPLDPSPERISVAFEATIERRVSSFTPADYLPYGGATNSDSFQIDGATIQPRQAFMLPIECGPYQEGPGGRKRDLRFKLAFAPTFDQVLADRGFNEVTGEGLIAIRSGEGDRVDRPWPLDGAGSAKTNSTDEPATLTLWPYRQLPFAGFGFS